MSFTSSGSVVVVIVTGVVMGSATLVPLSHRMLPMPGEVEVEVIPKVWFLGRKTVVL